MQKFWI
ncbi:hypothetical protein D046_3749A, partial [Vibrio parahaemolyticus V-223/04]